MQTPGSPRKNALTMTALRCGWQAGLLAAADPQPDGHFNYRAAGPTDPRPSPHMRRGIPAARSGVGIGQHPVEPVGCPQPLEGASGRTPCGGRAVEPRGSALVAHFALMYIWGLAGSTKLTNRDGQAGESSRSRRGPKKGEGMPRQQMTSTQSRVVELVHQVPDSRLQQILPPSSEQAAPDLDERFWGPAPSDVEVGAAILASVTHEFQDRQHVLGQSLSRSQVAELLGISRQAVSELIGSGRLLGLRHGREWRLPAWQLDADAAEGYLPGIADLLQAFPGGVISLTLWVQQPNADLDGRRPVNVLQTGGVSQVVAAARALTAAAW